METIPLTLIKQQTMDETKNLKYSFEYTDKFGNTAKLQKELTPENLEFEDELGLILENFKQFLLACGFLQSQVNCIEFVEKDDEN